MLSLLIECTVLMLKVVYEMYCKQRITYDEFKRFSEVKIQFLVENIDNIPVDENNCHTRDMINQCILLISQRNDYHLSEVYSFSSDIIQ